MKDGAKIQIRHKTERKKKFGRGRGGGVGGAVCMYYLAD